MTQDELDKCARLFRHLTGRSPKGDELTRLAGEVESFAQFRIHALLAMDAVPGRDAVIARWKHMTRNAEMRADANELLHAVELLDERHRQLDTQLLRTEAEMLEKLRAIDQLATHQSRMRQELDEMAALITRYRERLAEASPLPPQEEPDAEEAAANPAAASKPETAELPR